MPYYYNLFEILFKYFKNILKIKYLLNLSEHHLY